MQLSISATSQQAAEAGTQRGARAQAAPLPASLPPLQPKGSCLLLSLLTGSGPAGTLCSRTEYLSSDGVMVVGPSLRHLARVTAV